VNIPTRSSAMRNRMPVLSLLSILSNPDSQVPGPGKYWSISEFGAGQNFPIKLEEPLLKVRATLFFRSMHGPALLVERSNEEQHNAARISCQRRIEVLKPGQRG
jgi:hypothetical protein